MRILVVGSGGREHALVWALKRSPRVQEIHVAPGNGGMHELATVAPIAAEDVTTLVDYARQQRFDLTVIGPEVPISLGLTDALQAAGLKVFAPSQKAARLESSKAFAKDFMSQNHIPTAEYAIFEDYVAAQAYLERHGAPVVIKASGLAAGKGAVVCATMEEARETLRLMMQERIFGSAGQCVVIEERLKGQEVSILAFCDGRTVAPMLPSQDHKAAYDHDKGPNTGGMGCYAPVHWVDDKLMRRIQATVLQPTVDAMRRAGTPYVGVLYAGLMVSGDDFRVLEFNCRFGDPETQVILPLLKTDLATVLEACVEGRLDQVALEWSSGASVCVVMASGGYPGRYGSGYAIEGLDEVAALPNTVVFHAGTQREGERILTAGGRVLGVTAWAENLPSAIKAAYVAVERIHWPKVMFRRDIGLKGLKTSKEGA
jgi:phosphoribosylamine--glycine ligase